MTTPAVENSYASTILPAASAAGVVKRKRGRPRKLPLPPLPAAEGALAGNAQGYGAVQDNDRGDSIIVRCESCLSQGDRLYTIGKLKVCKPCENLMRGVTGSNRRQATKLAQASALWPGKYPNGRRDADLKLAKATHPSCLSPALAATTLSSTASATKTLAWEKNATLGTMCPRAHSILQSSAGKKRGRKPKAVDPSNKASVSDPSLQHPTSLGGNLSLSDSTSGSSHDRVNLSNFLTTGAFSTRTASKILGDQAVHGYAYGRAVKVRNIDGTWYLGSMVAYENGKVKVHFDGWGPEWDEWLLSDSRRLQALQPEEIHQREVTLETPDGEYLHAPLLGAADSPTIPSMGSECDVPLHGTVSSSSSPTASAIQPQEQPATIHRTSSSEYKDRAGTKGEPVDSADLRHDGTKAGSPPRPGPMRRDQARSSKCRARPKAAPMAPPVGPPAPARSVVTTPFMDRPPEVQNQTMAGGIGRSLTEDQSIELAINPSSTEALLLDVDDVDQTKEGGSNFVGDERCPDRLYSVDEGHSCETAVLELPPTLGNPIQLGLAPLEPLQFNHEDEESAILKIVHKVLGTGLIKNRIVEHQPEDIRTLSRRRRRASLDSPQGSDGEGEATRENRSSGEENDGVDESPQRTFTKTRDRFVALLESRQESRISQPTRSGTAIGRIAKKDAEELQRVRSMAMRNMRSSPIIQFDRQIIYNQDDRSAASNNTFAQRRQKLVAAFTGRKFSTQRRLVPSSSAALRLAASNALGLTFNEAGHVEKTASLKATDLSHDRDKMAKSKRKKRAQKAIEVPSLIHDKVQESFQSLRSLTRPKKTGRVLEDEHITFLRSTMVTGTRIRARDRQLDWLTALIRDVKNSRVLVHYEGYGEFYNEWIDINSERLQYDATLEQGPPSQPVETFEAPAAIASPEPSPDALPDVMPSDDGALQVRCVQCQVKVTQLHIYCTYCEAERRVQESAREPFNLCLWCFSNAFPKYHDHPQSSFATKVIVGPHGVNPVKGGIITRFEQDLFDPEFEKSTRIDPTAMQPAQFDMDQWRSRKICAFCNDDGISKDHFIGPDPFLLLSTGRYGFTRKRHFWAHDACARHSPEVLQGKDGVWFNVSVAMRRGRNVRCASCKEKGATIGCFDPKCGRSFHVPCAGKPMSHFKDGVVFWCPQHEQRDAFEETFTCDKCAKVLGVKPWQTCVKCSVDYFHTFDLCQECFLTDHTNHEHGKEDFRVTSLEDIYQEQLEKEAAQTQKQDESGAIKKKVASFKPKMRRLSRLVCSYCWSKSSTTWRKGYHGVLMCEDCFLATPSNEQACLQAIPDGPGPEDHPTAPPMAVEGNERGVGKYATSAEDYSHSPYLTRTAVSAMRFDYSSSQAVYLDSYGPSDHQLFSLPVDTTYYDIPGRAPRWATHSGTDYHGTWLPQTVRRAITKYTNPNDKVLSNFLGRGTDAIECFLLGRCCTAVDINPAAITLSIRNCSFAIPPDSTFKAEHRPIILQGDSRELTGPMFENESFDHVLSHPPYKDCVAYSAHIEGDLSRYGNALDFQREMKFVVRETYRLLKMGRRCTLGIGDNREHCFYIPVSFQLIRQYINEGFELEELIVKRQRYCAMFGLGSYLSVQFDFLCFTHEFIATLRKVPRESIDNMILEPDFTLLDNVRITGAIRAIPSCPVERKSVVMGSVWTFKPTEAHDFSALCVSRMVERFGKNEANWEEFRLDFTMEAPEQTQSKKWTEHTVEIIPQEEEDMASYERDRLHQIQENNRMLLALGLITDLSETSDDIGHSIKIAKDMPCFPPPAQTALQIVAHVPGTTLKSHEVSTYRTAVMHLAVEALRKLPITGVFIVGAQDFRKESGKLIPLSMLLLEDIVRVVGDDCLKLKELIEAVPDGYQKDRRKITCLTDLEEEVCTPNDQLPNKHLPIVHACYLVFSKVREHEE